MQRRFRMATLSRRGRESLRPHNGPKRKGIAMSMGMESIGKIEQAKCAVGSILNLLRYQPVTTLTEAETRLRLLDEFAMEALLAIDDVESAEFPGTEHTGAPRPSSSYLGPALPEFPSHLGTRH